MLQRKYGVFDRAVEDIFDRRSSEDRRVRKQSYFFFYCALVSLAGTKCNRLVE